MLILVLANGFFVASEFALVSVRRSRVTELVGLGRRNARTLQGATDQLDLYLAATQFGITLASLALGMIGEPALAHLIEPALFWLPTGTAGFGAHAISVGFAFVVITAMHIVIGELAPKSLALQRSEATALAVVGPLRAFVIVFRPAIHALNWLGAGVLRCVGLKPASEESGLHTTGELRLLIDASREAGLIEDTQHAVVARVFGLGERRVREIMTPRHDIDWIDLADGPAEQRRQIQAAHHEQVIASRGELDEVVGVVRKQDLLDQLLDSTVLDIEAAVRPAYVVHELTPILRVFEAFKAHPHRLAVIVDEYGVIQGLVTQTDLVEAMGGAFAPDAGEPGEIVEQADGSLVLDGMVPAFEAFARLGLPAARGASYTTLAGYLIDQMGEIPGPGQGVTVGNWRIEVARMESNRIERVVARRLEPLRQSA